MKCRCFAVKKEAPESLVKELEISLATQAAEAKKYADAAESAAPAREKQYVERLAFLARNVRG